MQELTIRQLVNTKFKGLYLRLLRGDTMTDSEVVKLLAIAVLLLNHKASDIRRLGYRIILFYGNATGKYEALYDVALNSGLLPVSSKIDEGFAERDRREDSFLRNIVGSYIDTFRDQGIVLTEQQDALRTFVQSESERSSVIVAPTSYGKSELIIQTVRDNPDKRVLILVPSKALLSQTKKRLLDAGIVNLGTIIVHPEMYSNDRVGRVAVLTQERLNRLLNEQAMLSFDTVFIDEAHNILDGDRRSELLAAMLCVLGARNRRTAFKFLTPFLCDELNVQIRYLDMVPKGFRIDEYIKSERFYVQDFRSGKNDGKLKLYDHFLDEWTILEKNYGDCFELIKKESLSKNIIYGNKKKDIEAFALALAASLPAVKCPMIARACDELQNAFDVRYRIISCLKKGVMYHHGSIPDTVRLYLERLFSKSQSVRYLVCNSTLLEGINLPIERLFLFDYSKGVSNLTSSQFKNLVGRVNRFSEVFSANTTLALKKLESSVFLLGIDGFTRKKSNFENYCKKSVHVAKVDRDIVSNVLLEAADVSERSAANRLGDAVDRLENMQPGLVKDGGRKYVSTELGRLLIANSVNEIDVFNEEMRIDKKITAFIAREGVIGAPGVLMNAIKECFIDHFDDGREYSDLMRLQHPAAIRFYSMLLDWKLKHCSVKEAIRLTLRYWDDLINSGRGDYVFVGTWGDTQYGKASVSTG